MKARDVACKAAELMHTRKGGDVVILDLGQLSSATDFFVICSAESDTQVRAVADAVIAGLEGEGVRITHLEGYQERRWVLIDCFDVVVHIFLADVREYYALERLWGDAPLEKIEG